MTIQEYWLQLRLHSPRRYAARNAAYRSSPEGRAAIAKSHNIWLEKNREKWNAYQREYARRKREERKEETAKAKSKRKKLIAA